MLYKSIPVNVKDIDLKQGIITGYWSSFGVADDGDPPDVVEKGAFAKSIQERGPGSKRPRIKFLLQHSPFYVLGVPSVLLEDNFGLYFESKILKTTFGNDTLVLYEGGAINEHSFGYDTVKAPYDKEAGVRRLKEVVLWEGSAVTWGMNPNTPVTGIKAVAEANRMAEQMARVEKILRHGNLQTDDLCEALELQLKQWRSTLVTSGPPEREHIEVDAASGERAPEAEKEDEAVLFKAKDFTTTLTLAQTEEKLWNQWWLVFDTLRATLRGILTDATVTDKAAAAGASLDQFKAALVDWVAQAAAIGFWSEAQKAAAFLAGMESKEAELGGAERKDGAPTGDRAQRPSAAKSADFSTLFTQAVVAEDLHNTYWMLTDALRGAIRSIMKDAALTDKPAAAAASADQFKVAMLGWVGRAAAAGLYTQKAKDAPCPAERKDGGPDPAEPGEKGGGPGGDPAPESDKEGRVLSEANRKLIGDTVAALNGAATALQALLTATEPAPPATQPPAEPPKTGKEPADATPNPSLEDLAGLDAVLQRLATKTQKGATS